MSRESTELRQLAENFNRKGMPMTATFFRNMAWKLEQREAEEKEREAAA